MAPYAPTRTFRASPFAQTRTANRMLSPESQNSGEVEQRSFRPIAEVVHGPAHSRGVDGLHSRLIYSLALVLHVTVGRTKRWRLTRDLNTNLAGLAS